MDDNVASLSQDLTVIGLGSSAGGLEAIRDLVTALPTDVAASYVIVQHMSPHHKSLMTELVSRQTKLAVEDVIDGTTPERNVIYITPPNTDVIIKDGVLHLVDPERSHTTPKPSVDRFLQSLAEDCNERAMAVILSGTGTDGAYGIQAVREAGGITIAQSSDSAKYDGMPTAAFQTGCVDLVLDPAEIGTHLEKILTTPRDFSKIRRAELDQSPMADILQILMARTKVDFREYKQTTISRRIEKRMLALGIHSEEDYADHCRNNPQAVDALYRDLLISVTRFFRDRPEFDDLNERIVELVEKNKGRILRIWVAGCATGEEAYSVAMLLAEALNGPGLKLENHVQIFATDIDENALRIARAGRYSAAALDDIPKALADKYVVQDADGIRISENLRKAILFSHHNIYQDPPFQRIDMVCCRNVLIYFGNSLQQKVMRRFHYALADNGYLFLGTAESATGSDELFVKDSSATRIYRKRSINFGKEPPLPISTFVETSRTVYVPKQEQKADETSEQKMFDALAQGLGKNSVLVRDDYSIVRVFGNVSSFIDMSDRSKLKMNLDLLRSPLREEARSLMAVALKSGEMRKGSAHLLSPGDDTAVVLSIFPIVSEKLNERAAVIAFETVDISDASLAHLTDSDEVDAAGRIRIQSLELDIAATREALRQTIEELETSNEELQSLNEELQSTNEELQATNEELETSNEELQSTNEELITVNEELQVTTSELSSRTSELTSVLQSAPTAILVLDNALQILQATSAAISMLDLNPPLSNPHVSQCSFPPDYPPIAPICSETLTLGQPIQREFSTGYTRVRITTSPFFDERGAPRGVSVVITEFPGLAREMELLLNTSDSLVMRRDKTGKILSISDAWAKLLGTDRETAEGANYFDMIDEDEARQVEVFEASLWSGRETRSSQVYLSNCAPDEGPRWLDCSRYLYSEDNGGNPSVVVVAKDITEERRAQENAKSWLDQMEVLQNLAGIGYWSVNMSNQDVYWSDEVYRIHGYKPGEIKPDLETAIGHYHADDVPEVRKHLDKVAKSGGEFAFELRLIRKDKSVIKVSAKGLARPDSDGKVAKISGVFEELEA